MAIGKYSAVPPPTEPSSSSSSAHLPSQAPTQAASQTNPAHTHSAYGNLDIEAWTIQALQSLSVAPNPSGLPGIGSTPLAIPLDGAPLRNSNRPTSTTTAATSTRGVSIALNESQAAGAGIAQRRPPLRRDSLKRREALLKGKEGSRQRRRWDMARLADVPFVEPPLPSDWAACSYRAQYVPYHVAQHWDAGLRKQVEDKAVQKKHKAGVGVGAGKGRVPRDLRDTVKKTPGVKGWVRTLEGPVRQFLIDQGEGQEAVDESDFSDEEIVFVGRKAAPFDGLKKAHREVDGRAVDRGMIYDSLEDGESGSFKYVLLIICILIAQPLHLRRPNSCTGDFSHIRSQATTVWNLAPWTWALHPDDASTLESRQRTRTIV